MDFDLAPVRPGLQRSSVRDMGMPPDTFARFQKLAGPDIVAIGIGKLILPGDIVSDKGLERFFTQLGAQVSGVGQLDEEIEEAVDDLVSRVVDDYRSSSLYRRHPGLTHQIYGEVIIRVVSPPTGPPRPYDDQLLHVDFGDPTKPRFHAYLAWSDQGTMGYDGKYYYEDQLVRDYGTPKNLDLLRSTRGSGRGMLQARPGPGMCMSEDGRTFLHRSDFSLRRDTSVCTVIRWTPSAEFVASRILRY